MRGRSVHRADRARASAAGSARSTAARFSSPQRPAHGGRRDHRAGRMPRRIVICRRPPRRSSSRHCRDRRGRCGGDRLRLIRDPARSSALASRPSMRPSIEPMEQTPLRGRRRTEWVLLTSGTTGVPEAGRARSSRASPRRSRPEPGDGAAVWSTFYDIRRYGGLQILLRAVLGGGSLVLSSAGEPVADLWPGSRAHGVTHMSGTPSHWRRALMSAGARADRAALCAPVGRDRRPDDARQPARAFPQAGIAHAFASTEAGVALRRQRRARGLSRRLRRRGMRDGVEMKVEDGTLRIRSARNARALSRRRRRGARRRRRLRRYRRHGRAARRSLLLRGRNGGIINVGGLKVHPEEVEAVINRHPRVRMSLVGASAARSPARSSSPRWCSRLGAARRPMRRRSSRRDPDACRETLPRATRCPAALRFVPR